MVSDLSREVLLGFIRRLHRRALLGVFLCAQRTLGHGVVVEFSRAFCASDDHTSRRLILPAARDPVLRDGLEIRCGDRLGLRRLVAHIGQLLFGFCFFHSQDNDNV